MGEGVGVLEDGGIGSADVAGEDEGFCGPPYRPPRIFGDGDGGGAQDVAGVAELDDDGIITEEVEGLVVFEGFEEGDGFFGVVLGVEGDDGVFGVGVFLFVEVGGVFFLDFGGVHEHEGGDGG